MDSAFGENEAVKLVDDGGGGEDGYRVDEIVGFQFVAEAFCKNFFDVVSAEVFATARFGRLEF